MTPSRQTPAERTVAAECRAVEEGHKARRAGDGRHFLVRSDSVAGRDYYVRIVAGEHVCVFECDHATYHGAAQAERTFVPCKHGALAARRLEREGLLRWSSGRWVATAKALALVVPEPADPFEGLS
jgi:hypothetical protein